ncbi:MAG: hypothetical protein IPH34_16475 [Chitinophagaceae bacterium]|nr:hypothetical protein [Chitinophagaceae bacterium]
MDLFKEQGVIDELGLGTIRDSLSDILFPRNINYTNKSKVLFTHSLDFAGY